jgi:hypothetical protein
MHSQTFYHQVLESGPVHGKLTVPHWSPGSKRIIPRVKQTLMEISVLRTLETTCATKWPQNMWELPNLWDSSFWDSIKKIQDHLETITPLYTCGTQPALPLRLNASLVLRASARIDHCGLE